MRPRRPAPRWPARAAVRWSPAQGRVDRGSEGAGRVVAELQLPLRAVATLEEEGGRDLDAHGVPLRARLSDRLRREGPRTVAHQPSRVESRDLARHGADEVVGHVAGVLLLLLAVEDVDELPD